MLLVEALADGQRYVIKIYRYGIVVKPEVLAKISAVAPEQVIRLIDYGQADGHGYEVLEYVPEGSLRARLAAGPLAEEQIRALVRELSAALAVLHQHDLLHRDIKPENVLIRQWEPLRIALTDFGIASVTEATQHFTTTARTLRYAAPEAATGVIGIAADYWSLGMVVLEAVSGRHPFAGLSEAVLSYQLVTQPVDCSGVAEPWRTLCRGLLLRDPKQRWGHAEIQRWLLGDVSLHVATETPFAEGARRHYRPYKFQGVECWTTHELAVALARHWEEGVKDLRQGFILPWLRDELRDQDLARVLLDLSNAKKMKDDERLLRLLVSMAPDLPPVWKQSSLAKEDLMALANSAINGNTVHQKTLEELYRQDVLAIYAAAGHVECQIIREQWQGTVNEHQQAWNKMIKQGASAQWRPDQATVLPALLLVTGSPPFGAQLAAKIKKLFKALKNPPDYLKKGLNKPVSGMSLALCTILESQLRMESLMAVLEPFRQEFSHLMEHREVKNDLSQIESNIYAGFYASPTKLKEAVEALKIKIAPLDESVSIYRNLLKNFENTLSGILGIYETIDRTKSMLDETIKCLENAEKEANSVRIKSSTFSEKIEVINMIFRQNKRAEELKAIQKKRG
ncbi:MAG: serine/threonine protein kinase [Candidatus Competibacteraceae bacterium]|nr:serine/threonine protein kinase [Candidatus Competibacteraceae bacterium]